ncbi:MAG: hypothetical protein WCG45_04660 [bacterium]
MNFEVGDNVKITGGPYYMAKSGNKIPMGEKGVGTFVRAEEDGTALYVKISGMVRYVYIGPEHTSDTGTIMSPHKVVKVKVKAK